MLRVGGPASKQQNQNLTQAVGGQLPQGGEMLSLCCSGSSQALSHGNPHKHPEWIRKKLHDRQRAKEANEQCTEGKKTKPEIFIIKESGDIHWGCLQLVNVLVVWNKNSELASELWTRCPTAGGACRLVQPFWNVGRPAGRTYQLPLTASTPLLCSPSLESS